MRAIVISINSEHVDKIIKGSKKYEYRRKIAREGVDKLIIYATAPIKKVVAEATVIDILALPPGALWEETKEYSGISKEFFFDYFKGKDIAYAYKLGEVRVYDEPKSLSDFGLKGALQSFAYANYP